MAPKRRVWPGLIALTLLGGCSAPTGSLTGDGAARAADDFLASIAADGGARAYASAAPVFHAANGPNAWTGVVQVFDLDHVRKTEWTSRQAQPDGSVSLGGTLYLTSAVPRPIGMRMVKAGGGWQVGAIDVHSVASTVVGEGAGVPGLAIGTLSWTPQKLAQACAGLLAPLHVLGCGRPVALTVGATGACFAEHAGRLVGVTASVTAVQPETRSGTIACRVSD